MSELCVCCVCCAVGGDFVQGEPVWASLRPILLRLPGSNCRAAVVSSKGSRRCKTIDEQCSWQVVQTLVAASSLRNLAATTPLTICSPSQPALMTYACDPLCHAAYLVICVVPSRQCQRDE